MVRNRKIHKRRSYSRRRNYKRLNKRPTRRQKRSKYSSFLFIRRLAMRHPIASGIILILSSIVLFRLSFTNNLLSSGELVYWVWLVSIILFVAGLLTLKAWWRNHVSMFTSKHSVNWRNK